MKFKVFLLGVFALSAFAETDNQVLPKKIKDFQHLSRFARQRNINPARDLFSFPGNAVARESVIALANAKVVRANYTLLKRDFPQLENFTDSQINSWLLEQVAYISTAQVAQTEVNTSIPVADRHRLVYRPQDYGRAWVAQATDPRNPSKTIGLFDVKGGGALFPSQGEHKNGLATLGEALREGVFESLVASVLDDLAFPLGTVGNYAEIDAGFDVIHKDGSSDRAGLVVRQAHENRKLHSYAVNISERELENRLARYGLVAGDNIQGTSRGGLVDFGHYFLDHSHKASVISKTPPASHWQVDKSLEPPMGDQWFYSKHDLPWYWSHATARAVADGQSLAASQYFEDMENTFKTLYRPSTQEDRDARLAKEFLNPDELDPLDVKQVVEILGLREDARAQEIFWAALENTQRNEHLKYFLQAIVAKSSLMPVGQKFSELWLRLLPNSRAQLGQLILSNPKKFYLDQEANAEAFRNIIGFGLVSPDKYFREAASLTLQRFESDSALAELAWEITHNPLKFTDSAVRANAMGFLAKNLKSSDEQSFASFKELFKESSHYVKMVLIESLTNVSQIERVLELMALVSRETSVELKNRALEVIVQHYGAQPQLLSFYEQVLAGDSFEPLKISALRRILSLDAATLASERSHKILRNVLHTGGAPLLEIMVEKDDNLAPLLKLEILSHLKLRLKEGMVKNFAYYHSKLSQKQGLELLDYPTIKEIYSTPDLETEVLHILLAGSAQTEKGFAERLFASKNLQVRRNFAKYLYRSLVRQSHFAMEEPVIRKIKSLLVDPQILVHTALASFLMKNASDGHSDFIASNLLKLKDKEDLRKVFILLDNPSNDMAVSLNVYDKVLRSKNVSAQRVLLESTLKGGRVMNDYRNPGALAWPSVRWKRVFDFIATFASHPNTDVKRFINRNFSTWIREAPFDDLRYPKTLLSFLKDKRMQNNVLADFFSMGSIKEISMRFDVLWPDLSESLKSDSTLREAFVLKMKKLWAVKQGRDFIEAHLLSKRRPQGPDVPDALDVKFWQVLEEHMQHFPYKRAPQSCFQMFNPDS